ncbi:MAG: helicase-related protein [Bacteroidales bacterium]
MHQLIDDISSGKLKVKIHPDKNIHAKIYIFREKLKHDHGYGSVITGSSNLTDAGLANNFEFNVELRDNTDIDYATETFNGLWREGVEIDMKSVERLKKDTFLNDEFTPYEIYLKFLIEYFGQSIAFDPNSITDLPKGFKRLSYQVDAVNDGFSKMIKHNGFFLADVVGLGKTVVATLIAKKYFYHNGFPEHRSRTLIIVPPAIRENWAETIDQFNLDNTKIINNGSLHKIKDPTRYDLVIVDEAHKFRTDTADMYNALQKICKSSTRRKLPNDKDKTVPKKVILVSATPLNNRPEDIANQIYLFQDSKNSTLEIRNLQNFFRGHIDAYRKLNKNPDIAKVQKGVRQIYNNIRTKAIEPLIVRRTRTDLREHDLYSKDLIKQGIRFPEVKKPHKIYYGLDPELESLYDKTIMILSDENKGLTYNRYRAIGLLKPHKKYKYKQADRISSQLARIMKTLLVKRIDSSFYAFKKSLSRFLQATEIMKKMWDNGKIYIAPDLPVTQMIVEGREEELLSMVMEKSIEDDKIEICEPDDFEPGYIAGINRDISLLSDINEQWQNIDYDPKMDVFIEYLHKTLFDPGINPEQKLVIFSESTETTDYLIKELPKYISQSIISVQSKNRKDKMPQVRKNFDANIPEAEQENKYDIVITTEVLAEGVNLHRSNVIVNYDTPWNSTKLMQRIGRVNRIGSKAKNIHIYNFYPTAKVNSDIELEKKAIMKLQSFHVALGEDSQIYSPDEEFSSFGLFDKKIEEEKDEKLEYLMFIRNIKEENPTFFKKIKNMPLRARVGRENEVQTNSTICYLKDDRRDSFIYINDKDETEELTFIETAKYFEADQDEKPISLHVKHHNQVKTAIELFDKLNAQDKAKHQKVDATQGPNEKKASSYLEGVSNYDFINEDERKLVLKAMEAIRIGRFQTLHRDINKFTRSLKKHPLKPAIVLEKILGILKSYLPETEINENIQLKQDNKNRNTSKPEIIISESFNK